MNTQHVGMTMPLMFRRDHKQTCYRGKGRETAKMDWHSRKVTNLVTARLVGQHYGSKQESDLYSVFLFVCTRPRILCTAYRHEVLLYLTLPKK